jgi:hypothetical protein
MMLDLMIFAWVAVLICVGAIAVTIFIARIDMRADRNRKTTERGRQP